MHRPTQDLRITSVRPLISPAILIDEIPISESASSLVADTRQAIAQVIHGRDSRLVVVVGRAPSTTRRGARVCREAEDARRSLPERARRSCCAAISRSRAQRWAGRGSSTTPDLDGSFHVNKGLRLARKLLLDVNGIGLAHGLGVPRHPDSAVHRRSHVMGGHRRAHHRKPGASRARVWAFDAGRLQEQHRRQRAAGHRRGLRGGVGALVSRRHQAGRVGHLPHDGERQLSRDTAWRLADRARTSTPLASARCARGWPRRPDGRP